MKTAVAPSRLLIEPLERRHDRSAFACGIEPLDAYFRDRAFQDMKRNIATVFVAVEQATGNVCGYYTLSMASVVLDLLPEALARKMPRYPAVPAIRLGRLAVHLKAGNQGLGTHLLMDAMKRSVRNEVAWAAFIVDAKDGKAAGFYRKFGFHSFIDDPCHLFIMRKTIEPLFS